jgi:hypothetical protein
MENENLYSLGEKLIEATSENGKPNLLFSFPSCDVGIYEGKVLSQLQSTETMSGEWNRFYIEVEIDGVVEELTIINKNVLKSLEVNGTIYVECFITKDKDDDTREFHNLRRVSKSKFEEYQQETKKEEELLIN